jgi:hypothetical protein
MTTPSPDTAPAIAIIPYAERLPEGLPDLPLDRLDWPLGRPARLSRGTVADMAATDHLITYPKTRLYFAPRGRRKAQLSLMIVEPDAVHAKHLRLARVFHRRFFRVLTKSRPLIAAIPNGVFLTFGSTFIPDPTGISRQKTHLASLIASAKRDWEGHRLRHRIVDHIRAINLPVDVMGRGYRPFADKSDGLAPYRYSVVIENLREPSYFTEKLVDALLCDTVPIYWGAPDIAEFFDPAGLIACTSEDEVIAALKGMSDADYAARAHAIAENRHRALAFADLHGRAAQAILSAVR